MTDMRMRADPSSGYPGRTYRFYRGEKVFEFGHGLSYSNYSYKFVSVSKSKLDFKTSSTVENSGFVSVSGIGVKSCENSKISVVVGVENEGMMAGKHPVLLFVRRGEGGGIGPMKQLVGFQSMNLAAAEKGRVEFEVNSCEQLSRSDENGVMVIESGEHYLVVGDQEYPIRINV